MIKKYYDQFMVWQLHNRREIVCFVAGLAFSLYRSQIDFVVSYLEMIAVVCFVAFYPAMIAAVACSGFFVSSVVA